MSVRGNPMDIEYIRDAGAPPGRGRREAMTIDEIIDNFSLLDDWDDRYRYVIELGRGAPIRSRGHPSSWRSAR